MSTPPPARLSGIHPTLWLSKGPWEWVPNHTCIFPEKGFP